MLIFVVILTLSQILIAYIIFRREMRENIHKEQINDMVRLRLKSLKHEAALMQDDINATRVLRHDLRHHYRLLYTLLKNGDTTAALEHIKLQKEIIQELKR